MKVLLTKMLYGAIAAVLVAAGQHVASMSDK